MISDRQVKVVWLKSILRPPNHYTNIVCVILAGVEVGVVSDENWQSHLD